MFQRVAVSLLLVSCSGNSVDTTDLGIADIADVRVSLQGTTIICSTMITGHNSCQRGHLVSNTRHNDTLLVEVTTLEFPSQLCHPTSHTDSLSCTFPALEPREYVLKVYARNQRSWYRNDTTLRVNVD